MSNIYVCFNFIYRKVHWVTKSKGNYFFKWEEILQDYDKKILQDYDKKKFLKDWQTKKFALNLVQLV
jgi:hypothetical protein